MSEYSLQFHPAAKKELDKLDNQAKVFIVNSLSLFIEEYDVHYEAEMMKKSKIKKLQGEWNGFYRLRFRDYRVIYEKINDMLVIHIIRIAHRKEAY
ncbi:MAG: type II toxin-antitoxin system RelE/ParE family toxin [Sulfurimonas sp.]|nr:type II toxin-antitoxin system RelE/ParE family toxin [Sulfurimonas sp.]